MSEILNTTAMNRSGVMLALDTSTTVARVAVVDGRSGARLAAAEATAERHSSNLLRLCVETTERAGVKIGELAAIACGAGPGSFTGLRVGLAVAKGLALPHAIPLVLTSSLRALAWDLRTAAAPGEALLPCLDAGKGQVFAALCEASVDDGDAETGELIRARSEEWAVRPELLPPLLPAAGTIVSGGPGAHRYREIFSALLGTRLLIVDTPGPTAEAVAALARRSFARGEIADLDSAVPSYGRAPDITHPKRPARRSSVE